MNTDPLNQCTGGQPPETTPLNILVLYHPTYSARQKITNTMFIDDLTEYLTDWMASYRNILICGDFNIHIDDLKTLKCKYLMTLWEA